MGRGYAPPFSLYRDMDLKIYDIDTAKEIADRVLNAQGEIPQYKVHYFEKIKKQLQVHTEGKIFTKVINVFKNEEQESTNFVVDTYESVTKGSIWRGIDNIARIFNNTGFNITGDKDTIQALSDSNFFNDYIEDFIGTSTAKDPNSVQVWIKRGSGEESGEQLWESEFIETQFIRLINDNEIAFIDVENSDYTIEVDKSYIGATNSVYDDANRRVTKSYFEGVKYNFGDKIRIIYISRNQYIQIDKKGKEAEVTIENFPNTLRHPYTCTGVQEIAEGVYDSAVAPFIPFGNHALIQHRTYRSVEALFGYPRMSEVELPCENCVRGEEACDISDEYPTGLKTCSKCKGTGSLSLQSTFKIYKRKLFPDAPELNANIKPVEFFTPDSAILQYNAKAWKETLQMGEDAIYIQQRVETGNVESAKSREKQLESMYSWLGRISSVIYNNIQDAINNYCAITDSGIATVEKPMSFAIMSELEAFDYLNKIVTTDAPIFIKTSHIENFLNKYISKTSAVIKIVDILKRVDPFVFYTQGDLQALSDSGVINDQDWRVHAYAFPLLMQMYTRDPEMLLKDYNTIETQLMTSIDAKVKPKAIGISSDPNDPTTKLRGSVGGMYTMIQIAKSVSDGTYDLEAAVALVMDRFGLTEDEAKKQLGTPNPAPTV